MLRNLLERQGADHRRWRIALVLLLAPFAAYAFMRSGWMTSRLGPLVEEGWDFFCLGVALLGLGMRLQIAGYGQAAEAGEMLPRGELRTTGFYSIVRHPACLANFLILLSGTLLLKSPFFAVLVVFVAGLYYERLTLAKERVLLERHGESFTAWAARTPLILPKFSAWKSPPEKFSLRAAVRREAVTFAFIGVLFFTLETLEGAVIDGLPFWEWVHDEPQWLGLFAVSVAIFTAQLSRVWAILVLFLSSVAVGAVHVGKIIPSKVNAESRALNALAAGGYVLLLRHAAATVGKDDEEVRVNDCSTQRNLSEKGHEQAKALGRMLVDGSVTITRTISSQYCRTRETARLMGIEAFETMANLNESRLHVTLIERLFGNSEKDEKVLRPVRAVIGDWRERGNLLLVSHAPVISSLTYRSLEMGEGLILKPAPHKPSGFTIVGKIHSPL